MLALQGSEEAKQATNDLPVVNMLNRSQKIGIQSFLKDIYLN